MSETGKTVVITGASSVAQTHAQMGCNSHGAIRTMQAVLPSMRAAGLDLVINTSFAAGRVSVPFFGTCCATKHALEAHSQSLRNEVAPFGIDAALAEASPGKRPTHTVVCSTMGVDEGIALPQPRQDARLKDMQVDAVLGGADA